MNLLEQNDSLPFRHLRHVKIFPYSATEFQKTILFGVYRVTKFGLEIPNITIRSHVTCGFEEIRVANSRVGDVTA